MKWGSLLPENHFLLFVKPLLALYTIPMKLEIKSASCRRGGKCFSKCCFSSSWKWTEGLGSRSTLISEPQSCTRVPHSSSGSFWGWLQTCAEATYDCTKTMKRKDILFLFHVFSRKKIKIIGADQQERKDPVSPSWYVKRMLGIWVFRLSQYLKLYR